MSSQVQSLQLYKIISLPVPASTNKRLKHATKLLDLPNYIALTYQHDYYLPLTDSDLIKCEHSRDIHRNFYMALIPTTVPQCALALFENNVNQVSALCNLRFLENHISHAIYELTPTSVLVFYSEDLHLDCLQRQRTFFKRYMVAHFMVLNYRDLYFSPRLVHCYNSSSDPAISHPINLALIQEFFDSDEFKPILGNSLFNASVPLSLPNFTFYSHEISNVLTADAKTHLNLKKLADAAEKDQLIFKTLHEPLLAGEISLQSEWPDKSAIFSFV